MLFVRAAFLLILVMVGRTSQAQRIVPGYVVTAGQDSLRGGIVLHDEPAQQKQVDFITAQGTQRQLLDASQLQAYGYTLPGDTVRFVSVGLYLGRWAGKNQRVFLQQLVAGPVELFQYKYNRDYYGQPGRNGMEMNDAPVTSRPANPAHPQLYAPRYANASAGQIAFPPLSAVSARNGTGTSLLLRRRGQQDLVEATWWKFPADAVAYFADCPALTPDLQAKRYGARNLRQLVQRYNHCSSAPR